MTAQVDSFKAWCICLVAGLFFFYEFFQLNILDVLNPYLRNQFHLNANTLSQLSSIFLWSNLLGLIPAGILLDKYSVRRLILFALLICIIGVGCILIADHIFWLVMGRLLTGISNAFCFLSCVLLVSRWFSPAQQGLMMGLVVTIGFMGGMSAHTPVAYLLDKITIKHVLWLDLSLGALIWMMIYGVVLEAPSHWIKQSTSYTENWRVTLRMILRNPQTCLVGLYIACLNLPMMILCALWGMSYLQTVHDMHAIQASYVVSALFIGSMSGCPILGFLSDFYRTRKYIMALGILGTLFSILFLCIGQHDTFLLLMSLFFSIGFFSSAQVIGYPVVAESHLPEHVGQATSVASLLVVGGAALGQMLFGWLMQQHHHITPMIYTIQDFQYAMWMFPVTLLLASISLYFIRETMVTP